MLSVIGLFTSGEAELPPNTAGHPIYLRHLRHLSYDLPPTEC